MSENTKTTSALVYAIDFEKLKLERVRQGKSIKQVAELAQLDVKTIIRIEKRRVIRRDHTVGKIAKALNKDVEDFPLPCSTFEIQGLQI